MAVGLLGLVMAHHPMVVSGFRRIQTDLGDTRFNHYLLEHAYRWVQREPRHRDFWSPPFFYPVKNVAAYSDVLVAAAPVYWLWRALGASPDLSFGWWMVAMSALNYAAGLLFFKRGLEFGLPAAVAGASLVAFGAPRLNQLSHQQLLPFFYGLLALYAFSRLCRDRSMGPRARAAYWLLATAAVVAQLYTGVYLGWFLILGLGLAAVVALALPSCRGVVLQVVGRDAWALVAAGALAAVLLQPFLSHYLLTAREVRSEFHLARRALHPAVWSWLDTGERNWFWGWASRPVPLHVPAYLGGEHHLGIGYLTFFACGVGLYLGWQWAICRVAAVVALILWVATTYLPGDYLAMLAAGFSYYCAALLFHETDRPALRGGALAIVLAMLPLGGIFNPYWIVLGLLTIIFCILEIGRTRGRLCAQIVPGIAAIVLSLWAFGPELIVHGIILVAPAAGLLVYYCRSRRMEVGLASLAFLILLLTVIAFLDQPCVLRVALAAGAIALAASALRRHRPPAGLTLRALLIALPFVALFYHHDSLWLGYSAMIPGAIAIRSVGRVVLVLLVPAALGLACLVEILQQRRLAILSWIVVLVCLAEQAVTTDTFDAAANRTSIDSLARRIDSGQVAFYYHPVNGLPFHRYHLDAMWASLATGAPTVNGYSGHSPRSWNSLFRLDVDPEVDIKRTLADWERSHGFLPNSIQWIGEERPAMSRAETGLPPPASNGPGSLPGLPLRSPRLVNP
jgi:hypothetical protein